jgi:hypothetical protein
MKNDRKKNTEGRLKGDDGLSMNECDNESEV